MRNGHDHFLKHRSRLSRRAGLGRVFNVTRESWRVGEDPKATPPQAVLLLSGRTASEAADLARVRAEALPRHGFDKPSGSWWGADEEQFHRFVVHPGRPRARTVAVVAGSGLVAGLFAVALWGRHRSRRGGA